MNSACVICRQRQHPSRGLQKQARQEVADFRQNRLSVLLISILSLIFFKLGGVRFSAKFYISTNIFRQKKDFSTIQNVLSAPPTTTLLIGSDTQGRLSTKLLKQVPNPTSFCLFLFLPFPCFFPRAFPYPTAMLESGTAVDFGSCA